MNKNKNSRERPDDQVGDPAFSGGISGATDFPGPEEPITQEKNPQGMLQAAKQTAQRVMQPAERVAREAYEASRERVVDFGHAVDDHVRRYPWTSTLVGVGIGLLIGLTIGHTLMPARKRSFLGR